MVPLHANYLCNLVKRNLRPSHLWTGASHHHNPNFYFDLLSSIYTATIESEVRSANEAVLIFFQVHKIFLCQQHHITLAHHGVFHNGEYQKREFFFSWGENHIVSLLFIWFSDFEFLTELNGRRGEGTIGPYPLGFDSFPLGNWVQKFAACTEIYGPWGVKLMGIGLDLNCLDERHEFYKRHLACMRGMVGEGLF